MTFYVENETNEEFPFNVEELISTLTGELIKTFGIQYEVSLNVSFTDDTSIREINKEFRGIDKSTDVLSFPNLDFDRPSEFDIPADRKADYTDPETGELILGDIILNVDRIFSQAEEYGHSIKRETAFLVAHSCLHLCGYDHMTGPEEEEMISKQEGILNSLGITRGD